MRLRHSWEKLGNVDRCKNCGLFRATQGRGFRGKQTVYRARIGDEWRGVLSPCKDPNQGSLLDGTDREPEEADPRMLSHAPTVRSGVRDGEAVRPGATVVDIDRDFREWSEVLFVESPAIDLFVPPDEHVQLAFSRYGNFAGNEHCFRILTVNAVKANTEFTGSWPKALRTVFNLTRPSRAVTAYGQSGSQIHLYCDGDRLVAKWHWRSKKKWEMEVVQGCYDD